MNFWMQWNAFLGQRVDVGVGGCQFAGGALKGQFVELDPLVMSIVTLDSTAYTSLVFLGVPPNTGGGGVSLISYSATMTVSGVLPDGTLALLFNSEGVDGAAPLFNASDLSFTEYRVTGAQGLSVRGAAVTITEPGNTDTGGGDGPPIDPTPSDIEYVGTLPGSYRVWRYTGRFWPRTQTGIQVNWTDPLGQDGSQGMGECDQVRGLVTEGDYQFRDETVLFVLHENRTPQSIEVLGGDYIEFLNEFTDDGGQAVARYNYKGTMRYERLHVLRHTTTGPRLLDRDRDPGTYAWGENVEPLTYGAPAQFSTLSNEGPWYIEGVSQENILRCGTAPLSATRFVLPARPVLRLDALTPGDNYRVRCVRDSDGSVVQDWAVPAHGPDGTAYVSLSGMEGVAVIVYLTAPGRTDADPALVCVRLDSLTDGVQLALPEFRAVPGAEDAHPTAPAGTPERQPNGDYTIAPYLVSQDVRPNGDVVSYYDFTNAPAWYAAGNSSSKIVDANGNDVGYVDWHEGTDPTPYNARNMVNGGPGYVYYWFILNPGEYPRFF